MSKAGLYCATVLPNWLAGQRRFVGILGGSRW